MWGSHPQERPKRDRRGEAPGADPTGKGAALSTLIAAGSRWGPASRPARAAPLPPLLLPPPNPAPPPCQPWALQGQGKLDIACVGDQEAVARRECREAGGSGAPSSAWRLPHRSHRSRAPLYLERDRCGWWKGTRRRHRIFTDTDMALQPKTVLTSQPCPLQRPGHFPGPLAGAVAGSLRPD